jgi:hypothetical protein
MEIHRSLGTSIIVALMAAQRVASRASSVEPASVCDPEAAVCLTQHPMDNAVAAGEKRSAAGYAREP